MRFFDLMKKAALDVEMEFTEAQYEQFIKYMRLLQEWNEKINLTAITEDEEVVKKHFIDCIKAFKSDAIKNANTVIDVGTGAGFPGLPIAIMNPEVKETFVFCSFIDELTSLLIARENSEITFATSFSILNFFWLFAIS